MRRSTFGRTVATACVVTASLLVGACGGDSSESDILSAGGWPGVHSDARNSDTSDVTGSRSLSLSWSRPIGGTVQSPVSIAKNGQLFVTSNVDAGCNLFSFQMPSGRKRFCNRLSAGVATSTPVIDGATNVYVGDTGGMNSFNDHGQPRWRTPVVGTPMSAQFTADGNVLFVTQLGEIDVVARQTGERVATPFQLLGRPDFLGSPNEAVAADDKGLSDCFFGAAGCPVANAPAVDLESGKFYLTLWRPGAPSASLVAMRYDTSGDRPRILQEWSADNLTAGSASSPTLSADGHTVYISDNEGTLIAMDTADGRTKWTHKLGYVPLGDASVSDDGLIIPGGGRDGHLLALRDRGDSAEVAWERNDLVQRGVPVQTKGDTGYTVVRTGTGDDDGLSLLTFDTQSGATVKTDVLPDVKGTTVGTSVGANGEVVVTTLIGELLTFK